MVSNLFYINLGVFDSDGNHCIYTDKDNAGQFVIDSSNVFHYLYTTTPDYYVTATITVDATNITIDWYSNDSGSNINAIFLWEAIY